MQILEMDKEISVAFIFLTDVENKVIIWKGRWGRRCRMFKKEKLRNSCLGKDKPRQEEVNRNALFMLSFSKKPLDVDIRELSLRLA